MGPLKGTPARDTAADGAVNEAAGEHLFLSRASFALEEATWNLAGGVGLLLVLHGKWEEIQVVGRSLARHTGHEDHGVAKTDHDRAVSLSRDLPGFDDQFLVALAGRQQVRLATDRHKLWFKSRFPECLFSLIFQFFEHGLVGAFRIL